MVPFKPRNPLPIIHRHNRLISFPPITGHYSDDTIISSPTTLSPSSWTPAIRSSTDLGRHRQALTLYFHMHSSGHSPDPFAISAALKACSHLSSPSSPSIAASLHAHVLKYGHPSHPYPNAALLHLYSTLHGPAIAHKLFDEMPLRNVVAWNSILSSHLRGGDLDAARKVFDTMPVRDVVSWNSMVSGYAKAGDMERAIFLFERMVEKNSASWNGIIGGYIDGGNMGKARELFEKMPIRSNVSWVAMISGYSRSGSVRSARELFDRMQERDVFSWNAMIACYAKNGHPRGAIHLFNRMRKPDVNVRPDGMTFSSIISACSQLGNLRYGLWIEEYMSSIETELDDHLATALVDLYSKCGGMDRAFRLFAGLRRRDLVSYSAIILGCGINGRSSDAVSMFKEMLADRIEPNSITFVGLLTAYNHAGLVEEAQRCFASMWCKHGIKPSADHYAIMVDLLGRSGRLDEAYQTIKKMPMSPHVGVWGALLLACRLHGEVEIGEIAARRCFELEPEASGYYVLLANIYAEAGEWEKAKRLRKVMVEKGLTKVPGCSWVQPTT